MLSNKFCPVCQNEFNLSYVESGFECENCGNVLDGVRFLDNEITLSTVDSFFSSFSTGFHFSQSSSTINNYNQITPASNYSSKNSNTKLIKQTQHTKTTKTKSPFKLNHILNPCGEINLSSRIAWNAGYRTTYRRIMQISCDIERIFNHIQIGSRHNVFQMIQKYFDASCNRIQCKFKLEKLVASCCYIQGRIHGSPVTLKDITSRLESDATCSTIISNIIKVCKTLKIHSLPSFDPLAILDRILKKITDNDYYDTPLPEGIMSYSHLNKNTKPKINQFEKNTTPNINQFEFDHFNLPSSKIGPYILDAVTENDMITSNTFNINNDSVHNFSYSPLIDLFNLNFESKSYFKVKPRKEHSKLTHFLISTIKDKAANIRLIFNEIIHITSIENSEFLDQDYIDCYFKQNFNQKCEAAFYSAVLSVSLWTLSIKFPIRVVLDLFNASRSSYYRKRKFVIQRLLSFLSLQNDEAQCKYEYSLVQLKKYLINKSQLSRNLSDDSSNLSQVLIPSTKLITSSHKDTKISYGGENIVTDTSILLIHNNNQDLHDNNYHSTFGKILHVYGIHNDRKAQRWILRWKDNSGKRHNKCFSQKSIGIENSMQKAKIFLHNLLDENRMFISST